MQGSNGRPRWPLGYPLAHSLSEVYPDRATIKWNDQARFAAAYIAKLDKVGPDVLRRLASNIRSAAGAEGDVPLVVLCYENLTKPGNWCHRSMFAAWWHDRTGETVPELGGVRIPELRSHQTVVLPCDADQDDPNEVLF